MDNNVFGQPIPSPNAILKFPRVLATVRLALGETFRALELSPSDIESLVDDILALLGLPLEKVELEKRLRERCAAAGAMRSLRVALDRRCSTVAEQIAPHLLGPGILDVGCGDGIVSKYLDRPDCSFLLADVVKKLDPRAGFSFQQIPDRGVADLPTGYQTALLSTVLHHAYEPLEVIQSVARAAPRRIVVIESVLDAPGGTTPLEKEVSQLNLEEKFLFCVFGDWLFNRTMIDNSYLPYNFGYVWQWEVEFKKYGYLSKATIPLGIDQVLVPEVHVLMVFERA